MLIKRLNFFALFLMLIIGPSLYELFDFERFAFENVGLAVMYSVVLAVSLFMLVRSMINHSNSK